MLAQNKADIQPLKYRKLRFLLDTIAELVARLSMQSTEDCVNQRMGCIPSEPAHVVKPLGNVDAPPNGAD